MGSEVQAKYTSYLLLWLVTVAQFETVIPTSLLSAKTNLQETYKYDNEKIKKYEKIKYNKIRHFVFNRDSMYVSAGLLEVSPIKFNTSINCNILHLCKYEYV